MRLRRKHAAVRVLAFLCSVSAIALGLAVDGQAGQLPDSAFQAYDATAAATIQAGPFALFKAPVNSILPTQLNLGFTEVGKKTSAYDLLKPSQLAKDLLNGSIEPVVIGPGGILYLTNGHHTFTSLLNSIYGSSNPFVYVNVIANYSDLTSEQFWAKMQASNFLLPLDNGLIKPVDPLTGAPIPSAFAGMTNDPYRGLEYSILKNKSSKLFTTGANITGAIGSALPGLDKTAAFYSDFIWANAYRGANNGLGLPYLSPADIAIATRWNLTGSSATTLTNVGAVTAAQLPGYILPSSLSIGTTISDAMLAGGVLDGNGTFTGIRNQNLGSVTIGSTAPGFIMQLGADAGGTVTLTGVNTYTGGTTVLAGTLIINSDSALGAAAPTTYNIDPSSILASVQAANGITFNSLSEGSGTLQVTSSFSTNRPVAVSGESANINVNGSGTTLTLTGQIASVGSGGTGLGAGTGETDIAKKGGGTLIVAPTGGSNPLFYGNWIVSNGTLTVSSDAALGNTTGPSYTIGQIVLDGGTFKPGASFSSVRSLVLTSGSTYDTAGFTTSFAGSITDVQRRLTISNSSASTAGAVTFGSLNISGTNLTSATGATATLLLSGGTQGETVTFTNNITRADRSTLFIQPSSTTSLGNTEKVFSTAPVTQTNGIVAAWIMTNVNSGANSYDFMTYGANGYVKATYSKAGNGPAGGINAASSTDVVEQTGNGTMTTSKSAYALKVDNQATITINAGQTLTLGDGTNPAGLIFGGSGTNASNILGGALATLAFGGSEAVIYSRGTAGSTIGTTITGTNGLTFAGEGSLTLSVASSGLSGPVNIDSGTLNITAANALTNVSSVNLSNVSSNPAAAGLSISASNTFASLNSAGSNSSINITNAAAILTIGQTGNADASLNNLDSTISSTITDTAVASGSTAIVKAGSGMLDLSGATLTLTTGSNISVTGGTLRLKASGFTNTNNIVTASGTEIQFAQDGGSKFAGNITGAGMMHLIGGTLQLTGTGNSYGGGTVVEQGSTLSLTTANVSSGNANITNAGGLIVFDQASSGSYSGVISDGRQMQAASGPLLSGSLVKDDSSGASGGNVTLLAKQAYTGGTFVEAGTLTLGVTDAVATSAGVDLGRVGGPKGTGAATDATVTATLALGADNTIKGLMSEAGNNTAVQLNGFKLTVDTAAGTNWSFGGAVLGSGTLAKSGEGVLELAGVSTYAGPTQVDGGVLAIARSGRITSDVTNKAIFSNSGVLNGSLLNNAGISSNTGTITGNATVNGGLLSNDGVINGAVAVNSGGTLGGIGTVGSTTISGGGTLSPGNSIGTITISGNLVFGAGAIYRVEASPTEVDRANVTGNASLTGGIVQAVFVAGNYMPRNYTVLSAAGGFGGTTFAALSVTGLPAGFSPSMSYTSTDVLLSLTAVLGAGSALSQNERSVAGAINSIFNNGGALPPGLLNLFGLTGSSLTAALSSLSGDVHASTVSVLANESLFMRSAVLGRLRQASYGGGADTMAALGLGGPQAFAGVEEVNGALAYAKAPMRAPNAERDVVFWAQGFGAWGRFEGGGNAATVRRDLAGLVTGVDTSVGTSGRAGLAAGYTSSRNGVDGRGSSSVETAHVAAYGGWRFGALNLRAGGAYAVHTIDTDRTIAFPGVYDRATAHYDGGTGQIFGELGYGFALGNMAIESFAGGAWARVRTESAVERAMSSGLNVAGTTFEVGYATLGLRAASMVALANGMMLVPRGSLAWQHAFGAATPGTALALQTAPALPFVISGVPIARDALLAEAGLDLAINSHATIGVSYSGQVSRNVQDHAAKGKFSWSF